MKQVRIGGQAVLEGIMMKGPTCYALAVRKSNGEVAVDITPYSSFGERKKLNRIPIVRGVVNFIESLYIGIKTLMASSEYFEEEEESEKENPDEAGKEKKAKKAEKEKSKDGKKDNSKGVMIGTLVFSLAFAIGLFVLLPSFLAGLLLKVTEQQWIANLVEGVLRLAIFLLYVALISKMEDIRRTFMYHGAEHKAINCLEAGDDLTPENVLKHTRFHKRCGTSFVFIVMIISIIVFMFVHTEVMWLRLLSRILLIPVIAGLSYEVLQYAGRHENACSRIMSAPGLWVQRLTTKEPDLSMAEVAIWAVEQVVDVREYLECVRNNSFEK